MINQTMLSNRRSYADLFVRLVSADVEREKTQRTKWRRRVEDWKSLNTKLAVEGFRQVNNACIVNLSNTLATRNRFIQEQQKAMTKRWSIGS